LFAGEGKNMDVKTKKSKDNPRQGKAEDPKAAAVHVQAKGPKHLWKTTAQFLKQQELDVAMNSTEIESNSTISEVRVDDARITRIVVPVGFGSNGHVVKKAFFAYWLIDPEVLVGCDDDDYYAGDEEEEEKKKGGVGSPVCVGR
jgi:hypothetical protein